MPKSFPAFSGHSRHSFKAHTTSDTIDRPQDCQQNAKTPTNSKCIEIMHCFLKAHNTDGQLPRNSVTPPGA